MQAFTTNLASEDQSTNNLVRKRVLARANAILEIARDLANQARKDYGCVVGNHIEEITIHVNGYAEPGYSCALGIIATGNWNNVTRHGKTVSNLPSRILALFEKLGIECEWSDEWVACDDCGKLVRNQGDSHDWKPSYWADYERGEILCHNCVRGNPDAYLEHLRNNPDACLTIRGIDLGEHGYRKHNSEPFGQDDSPQEQLRKLQEEGFDDVIFELKENSQFYSRWNAWVREND